MTESLPKVFLLVAGEASARSGVYQFARALAIRLKKKGCRVIWVSKTPAPVDGIEHVFIHSSGLSSLVHCYYVMKANSRDIWISCSPTALALSAFILTRRIIVVFHDMLIADRAGEPQRLKRYVKSKIYRWLADHSDRAFISKSLSKHIFFSKNAFFYRSMYLYNVYDSLLGSGRELMRTDNKKLVVGVLGPPTIRKGFPFVVQSLLSLLSRASDHSTSLEVVVSDFKTYQALVRIFDRSLVVKNWDKQLPFHIFYSQIDALLFLSPREGCGRPIFEAAVNDVWPIVATPEMVDEVYPNSTFEDITPVYYPAYQDRYKDKFAGGYMDNLYEILTDRDLKDYVTSKIVSIQKGLDKAVDDEIEFLLRQD